MLASATSVFFFIFFKQQSPEGQLLPGSLARMIMLCNGDHLPAVNNIIYLVRQALVPCYWAKIWFPPRAAVMAPCPGAGPGSPRGRWKCALLTPSSWSCLGSGQRFWWMNLCFLYSWLSWDWSFEDITLEGCPAAGVSMASLASWCSTARNIHHSITVKETGFCWSLCRTSELHCVLGNGLAFSWSL